MDSRKDSIDLPFLAFFSEALNVGCTYFPMVVGYKLCRRLLHRQIIGNNHLVSARVGVLDEFARSYGLAAQHKKRQSVAHGIPSSNTIESKIIDESSPVEAAFPWVFLTQSTYDWGICASLIAIPSML